MVNFVINNWGWLLFAGIFLSWIVINTIIICLGSSKTMEGHDKFLKQLNKFQCIETIIITDTNGFQSTQKTYEPRKGDGQRWGLSGIC